MEPKRVVIPTKASANLFTAQIQTSFHNSGHQAVTVVPKETAVHAMASRTYTGPIPTGTVIFHWYDSGTCRATLFTSPPMSLDGLAQAHLTTFGLGAIGVIALRVEYSGDAGTREDQRQQHHRELRLLTQAWTNPNVPIERSLLGRLLRNPDADSIDDADFAEALDQDP